jgi:hypothetical protein
VQNVIFFWNVFDALVKFLTDYQTTNGYLLLNAYMCVFGLGDKPFHYWEVLPLNQFIVIPHKTYDGRKTQES